MKFRVIENKNYKGPRIKKEKDISDLNRELYFLENKLNENILNYNFIKKCRILLYTFDVLAIIALLCFNASLFAILSLPVLMSSSIEFLLYNEFGASNKLKQRIERYTMKINSIKEKIEIINNKQEKNISNKVSFTNDVNIGKTKSKVIKLVKKLNDDKFD